MTASPRVMSSEYIEWAKLRAGARFNLATSGVMHYPLRELGATLDDLEISGPSTYGYEPLQQALAKKCGVSADCVVAAIGTSQANHLAMAATIEPGDEVLIERPAYHPMLGLAYYLGAEVHRFDRRHENGFQLEPGEMERNVTSRTRLIVLTNLHNPSGAYADAASLRQVGEIARRVGARVLVDEVYLEMLAIQPNRAGASAQSAFHLGNEFVVTNSLTKAYGLSGLRCGWILAEPELARRIWRLNDLFCNIPAHAAERLSVIALRQMEKVAQRSRALLDANRTLLDRFLDGHAELECTRPSCGTIVFPRLPWDSGKFCDVLREKYETSVVPGRFFEMPHHTRIGIGGATPDIAAGLERLDACLREFQRGH